MQTYTGPQVAIILLVFGILVALPGWLFFFKLAGEVRDHYSKKASKRKK